MNARTLKCLRLALDHRTPEGEALAALAMFRKDKLTWIEARDAIIELAVIEYEETRHAEAASDCQAIKRAAARIAGEATHRDHSPTFWFGKYKGKTIEEVFRINPGYLQWVLDKCDKLPPSFLNAIEELIDP